LKFFVRELAKPTSFTLSDIDIDLDYYDFTTAPVRLLLSSPYNGPLAGAPVGLGRVRTLCSGGPRHSTLVVQCSSIGSLNLEYLKQFAALWCNNPNAELHIIFPALQTVIDSHFGRESGGTTFLQPKTFKDPLFPKSTFHHFRGPTSHPTLTGHLSHSKIIIAYTGIIDDSSIIYSGSHNLSQVAWGKLTNKG
jgi:hypothetical protein